MATKMMTDAIEKCESFADFRKLFDKGGVYSDKISYADWKCHISDLMEKRGLTKSDIAKALGISNTSAARFINEIPSRRRNVIMLAMVLHMNLDETDELLVRWAKYQKLYSKNPEDAIWMYLIKSERYASPSETFKEIYNSYLEVASKAVNSNTDCVKNTMRMDSELYQIMNDKEFIEWMVELAPVHKTCHEKLINHIDGLLANANGTINQLLGEDEKKRDKYYRILRLLREEGRVPERDFLISFGIQLKLNTENINKLLDAAGMGNLLSRDLLEGLVIFFIEELYCNYPSMFADDQDAFGTIDKDLICEDENGNSIDFPAETIAEYVKIHIEEAGIDFKDKKRLEEFLRLV